MAVGNKVGVRKERKGKAHRYGFGACASRSGDTECRQVMVWGVVVWWVAVGRGGSRWVAVGRGGSRWANKQGTGSLGVPAAADCARQLPQHRRARPAGFHAGRPLGGDEGHARRLLLHEAKLTKPAANSSSILKLQSPPIDWQPESRCPRFGQFVKSRAFPLRRANERTSDSAVYHFLQEASWLQANRLISAQKIHTYIHTFRFAQTRS